MEVVVNALKNNISTLQIESDRINKAIDGKSNQLFQLKNMLGKVRMLEDAKNIRKALSELLPRYIGVNYHIYYSCLLDRQLSPSTPIDQLTSEFISR